MSANMSLQGRGFSEWFLTIQFRTSMQPRFWCWTLGRFCICTYCNDDIDEWAIRHVCLSIPVCDSFRPSRDRVLVVDRVGCSLRWSVEASMEGDPDAEDTGAAAAASAEAANAAEWLVFTSGWRLSASLPIEGDDISPYRVEQNGHDTNPEVDDWECNEYDATNDLYLRIQAWRKVYTSGSDNIVFERWLSVCQVCQNRRDIAGLWSRGWLWSPALLWTCSWWFSVTPLAMVQPPLAEWEPSSLPFSDGIDVWAGRTRLSEDAHLMAMMDALRNQRRGGSCTGRRRWQGRRIWNRRRMEAMQWRKGSLAHGSQAPQPFHAFRTRHTHIHTRPEPARGLGTWQKPMTQCQLFIL